VARLPLPSLVSQCRQVFALEFVFLQIPFWVAPPCLTQHAKILIRAFVLANMGSALVLKPAPHAIVNVGSAPEWSMVLGHSWWHLVPDGARSFTML